MSAVILSPFFVYLYFAAAWGNSMNSDVYSMLSRGSNLANAYSNTLLTFTTCQEVLASRVDTKLIDADGVNVFESYIEIAYNNIELINQGRD